MWSVLLVLFLILVAGSIATDQGDKIYRVEPNTVEDIETLLAFNDIKSLNFLTPLNKVGKPINILATQDNEENLSKYLTDHKINFEIQVKDIEEISKRQQNYHKTLPKLQPKSVAFDRYLHFNKINNYLKELQTNYPGLVRLQTIGQSYGGKDLNLIHISNGDRKNKPTIFIDAGIHGREWIAPAVALYIINQLVEQSENHNMIEDINWSIFPIVNPDGYEFSFTDDRFWKKTCSKGKVCDGVDANLNFSFHWTEVGTEPYECSDSYAGPNSFSEKETQTFRDNFPQGVALYLTLHSCGEYLLYPWGWTDSPPDNKEELDGLAQNVKNAILAVRGTNYTVGSSANVFHATSGTSDDWVYGVLGIKLVYSIQLPCGGFAGIDLPEEDILKVAEETWEGIKIYHDYIANPDANNA